MSKVTFETIDAAVPPEQFGVGGAEGYENAGNHACKILLGIARRDPIAFKVALDKFRADPFCDAIEDLMAPEEKRLLFEGRWGLTGFLWGFAVQTAAYLLEQAPVPNPAIITIGSRQNAP